MAGYGSSTLSLASVMAAQAYVATRPAPTSPAVEEPAAAAHAALEPSPTDGTVKPVGDARRFRHWSALGAARRAVL